MRREVFNGQQSLAFSTISGTLGGWLVGAMMKEEVRAGKAPDVSKVHEAEDIRQYLDFPR